MPRCKAVSFDANRFDLVKTTTLAFGCRHKCCNNYPICIYAIKLIPSVISFDFTYYRIIATKSEILSVFAEASFRISQQKKKNQINRMRVSRTNVCELNIFGFMAAHHIPASVYEELRKGKLFTLHQFLFAIIRSQRNVAVNGYLFERIVDLRNAFML